MAGRLMSRCLVSPLRTAMHSSGVLPAVTTVTVPSRCKVTHDTGILSVVQRRGVRKLTLNHEKKRNALSYSMLENLGRALMPTDEDPDFDDVSCVVIAAKGKVFSSGHDLNEMREPISSPTPKELFDMCSFVMRAIHDFPVPVIAQVGGLATAAGCQLAASCDIVIAGESARFATPGVNIGLFCTTPSVPLLRCVPDKKGMYMLFTGEPITAEEALVHGLVSKVVPDDELGDATINLTDHLCSLSRDVLVHGKMALREIAHERTLETSYTKASHYMAKNVKMNSCQEGIDAFLTKRKPNWNNN